MFKSRHSPTSPHFTPVTPRPPRLSLPEERCTGPARPATSAGTRPETPPNTHASSRANPTAGQPPKPLKPKPILKGSKNAHAYDSCESDGEILVAKKGAFSCYNIPNVLPPGSHLGPMKPPAVDLHWQLLPFDRRRSRRLLRFDVAFPAEEIAFQDGSYRTKLTDAELNKLAANDMMTKMLITFEHGQFSWDVDVKNARGIRCRDVFEEIHKTLHEQLTPEEHRLVRDRRAVEEAFRLRCKLAFVPEAERALGWKRVDVLVHQTVFLGLTQPHSGGEWVLNLGRKLPCLS